MDTTLITFHLYVCFLFFSSSLLFVVGNCACLMLSSHLLDHGGVALRDGDSPSSESWPSSDLDLRRSDSPRFPTPAHSSIFLPAAITIEGDWLLGYDTDALYSSRARRS